MMYIMALSNLTLTIAAWYGVTVVKLQRLQNRAARVLTNSNYDADRSSILLGDLGWHNLETQQTIQKAVMVYKSLNCLAPDDMSS